jgi:hypothetical protein
MCRGMPISLRSEWIRLWREGVNPMVAFLIDDVFEYTVQLLNG